jgi:hypothetical protein
MKNERLDAIISRTPAMTAAIEKEGGEKISKLPDNFNENYIKWKVLERIGNYVFLQGKSQTGSGGLVYDQQLVRVDETGLEYIKSPMNWDSLADPMRKPTDPPPRQFSKDLIYQDFLASIRNNEMAILRRARTAEENRLAEILRDKNFKIITDMKSLAEHLQIELQELTDRSENSQGIFSNKRCKEILLQLSQIDLFLKHIKLS